MTDARLPSEWLTAPKLDNLSDRAWRTIVSAYMWSNGAGTDGQIQAKALRFLHPLGVDEATLTELIEAGWLISTDTGHQIPDWTATQTLAAEVEKARRSNRERQRRHRESRDVTRDITSDLTRESPRKGQERQQLGNSSSTELVDVVNDDGTRSDECVECQRRSVFGTGRCPNHVEVA